jgi:hypothetical protein
MQRIYQGTPGGPAAAARRPIMAQYTAVLMHGNRDAEGRHRFEADDDLMTHSPATVMRVFMEAMDATAGVGHIDYELNAAMKNRDSNIVTTLGSLVFHDNNVQPFICMIAASEA